MYSVQMGLVDMLPVLLFLWAAVVLQRDLYYVMSKGAYALLCAGTIDVFMAGFLKATYKILYAANICDFQSLKNLLFPMQSLGFVLAGCSMICAFRAVKQKKNTALLSAAPVYFAGTFLFVTMMVVGLFFMDLGLIIFAVKLNKKKAIPLFVMAFLFSLMMGYLSSKDFTQSYMNWVAEVVNTIGQVCLMLGVKMLDRAGLAEYRLPRAVEN